MHSDVSGYETMGLPSVDFPSALQYVPAAAITNNDLA